MINADKAYIFTFISQYSYETCRAIFLYQERSNPKPYLVITYENVW